MENFIVLWCLTFYNNKDFNTYCITWNPSIDTLMLLEVYRKYFAVDIQGVE